MSIWESFRLAFEGVWANKMRSSLTMLGIIIGIASVIAVVAIGQGGQRLLENEVSRVLGVNIFRIYINYQSGETVRAANDITLNDVTNIKDLVPELKNLTANNDGFVQLSGPRKKEQVMAVGTTGDMSGIQNLALIKGRFFNDTDVEARRPVILLDDKLANNLFGFTDPLGKKVNLGNSQMVVIGVVQSKQSFLNGNNSYVYLPITSWQDAFHTSYISYLEGQAQNKELVKEAMNKSVQILERTHRKPGHYQGNALEQELEQINQMTNMVTLIVGAIAGISLLVGGIGVMNIMLVSVTERTREIGIRKALGAQRRDIMLQFLIESLVICIIGGTIGTMLGIGGTLIISLVAKLPPLVSWLTIIIAFVFSSAVGIFFGLYPANKAAKLDPIEALRFE